MIPWCWAINWYWRIGTCSHVKVRLGRIGLNGHQKGVDLRIGLDLVTLASKASSDVFFLISGDGDFTEAVAEAQSYGVQVVVLAVPDPSEKASGVSRYLRLAADRVTTLPLHIITSTVHKSEQRTPRSDLDHPDSNEDQTARRPTPRDVAALSWRPARSTDSHIAYSSSTSGPTIIAPVSEPPDMPHGVMRDVCEKVLERSRQSGLEGISADRPTIPSVIDSALLNDLAGRLEKYTLLDEYRHHLRRMFWTVYDELPQSSSHPH